ncbi:MAG: hypothetical protein MUE73_07395 [Planctomycetes bacterium]|nr:hypothetical protein [Planctomycetota bacterium]
MLEAWEEAVQSGRLDQKKLAGLLTRLGYAKTTRRVGYLFDRCGWPAASPLRKVLALAERGIDRKAEADPLPLFADYEGGEYHARWHLTVPL